MHPGLRAIIMQGHTTQGEYGEMKYMKGILEKYNFVESYRVDHDEYPILVGLRNSHLKLD